MNMILFAVIFPFAIGILVWFVFRSGKSDPGKRFAAVCVILAAAVELAAVLVPLIQNLNGATFETVSLAGVGGQGLHFLYTGFRGSFAVLTAFAWFVTFLFSKEYMKNDTHVIRYDLFNLFTLGATMGIFYAADLFTLFFFFEIMSFTSFMWVAHRQTKETAYAAGTYLGIAIAGGMAILMGLFIAYNQIGTLTFGELYNGAAAKIQAGEDLTWLYVAAGCMFVGFGAKASAFPVHVWLPQSYTQAPAPATALLSAILSKTGVFGILLVSLEILPMQSGWGLFILLVGLVTMVLGGIRGVMSSNFKTTLAYSSMSQIGFILVGMAMQILLAQMMTASTDAELSREVSNVFSMAVNGTYLHMLNHSLVKLVLFMIAGLIFAQVGSYDLNRVRGFGHKKPFLLVTFTLAVAGVGGIPLLNGYVSKTLLHESIVEYTALMDPATAVASPMAFRIVEYLFLFSGGLTVAYMTKLFIVLFVEKNRDEKLQSEYESKKTYASVLSKIAIGLCALPIPFIGLFPGAVADPIARYGFVHSGARELWAVDQEEVFYFSVKNLSGALVSIIVGAIVYILIVRLLMLRKKEEGYRGIFPVWLDMERYVYRAVFYRGATVGLGIISRILDSMVDTIVVILRKTVYSDRPLPYELPEGNYFTHSLGRSIERVRRLYCTIMKKDYEPKNYEHKLAIKSTEFFESGRIIERSLSFGLFMFCLGLGLTMIYLLMVN